jgi:hypothetical protein
MLDESMIHPAVRERIAALNASTLQQVQQAIQQHAVVVVGMAMNPFPRKARKALDAAGVAYHYISYGRRAAGAQARAPLGRLSARDWLRRRALIRRAPRSCVCALCRARRLLCTAACMFDSIAEPWCWTKSQTAWIQNDFSELAGT